MGFSNEVVGSLARTKEQGLRAASMADFLKGKNSNTQQINYRQSYGYEWTAVHVA